MKKICQLYMPSFYRSYNKDAIKEATKILPDLKKSVSRAYILSLSGKMVATTMASTWLNIA